MHDMESREDCAMEVKLPCKAARQALERALADMAVIDGRDQNVASVAGAILYDHVFGVAVGPREMVGHLYGLDDSGCDMSDVFRECLKCHHGISATSLSPFVSVCVWILGRHGTCLKKRYAMPAGKKDRAIIADLLTAVMDDSLQDETGDDPIARDARLWIESVKTAGDPCRRPVVDVLRYIERMLERGEMSESILLAVEELMRACEHIASTPVERVALSDAIAALWEDAGREMSVWSECDCKQLACMVQKGANTLAWAGCNRSSKDKPDGCR